MSNAIFPIRTATACALKWEWSTLYLNRGIASTCHRTSTSELTAENFSKFHNKEIVLEDRRLMLQGQWPESNCSYCRKIEQAGGVSDRLTQIDIPGLVPPELMQDPTAIVVSPTILEVYFSNTCNLGCLYCNEGLSSVIEFENRKFGDFKNFGVNLIQLPNNYKNLLPEFWKWFPIGFKTLKRLHVMGGEPFYQKEFDKLLEFIDQHPNADCVLSVTTNLMVAENKLGFYLEKFKKLLVDKKVRRIDITCSIDCWGADQEYVRWGLDLEQWNQNFSRLLELRWITLNINQTISVLTIKTMPQLLEKLSQWRTKREIGHWFSGVAPGPRYLQADILGNSVFDEDIQKILLLLPQLTDRDKQAYNYMVGILNQIQKSKRDKTEVQNLLIFLNEKDRRRGTSWKETFPWLEKEFSDVV